MNRQFKISIGDWSGDGHGYCVHRIVECNMNINDVRAAFFKAREVIPKRCQPETVCSEYESYTIKAELADEIELGSPLMTLVPPVVVRTNRDVDVFVKLNVS